MRDPDPIDANHAALLRMTGASPDEIWPLVRDHHYSRRMPAGIRKCFAWRVPGGLFGDTGVPVAGVIYGSSSNPAWPKDALELQRLVRRPDFSRGLSTFVTWTLRWIRANEAVPFVFSYADTMHGHHGGIYQACGFHYVGETGRYQDGARNRATGEYLHGRTCVHRFGSRSRETLLAELGEEWELAWHETKHRYVFPIRQKMPTLIRRYGWTLLPYPKPAACPSDERGPPCLSQVQPLEAAPSSSVSL